ncbi:MAG TPA: nucleotidyl transferase AbiEii/AbiGii toxin family protein [Ignavibacteria bacterium]|nr:nucleotidyl transferase AbiEii/AbiGii toxin family protein [Ignavibacteria bacterium]
MNLHFNILPEIQKQLFQKFSKLEFLIDYYLAGGTALALQIGHRKSIDFDFFSQKDINLFNLKNSLQIFSGYEIIDESKNTLYVNINGVKTSFISYSYPMISNLLTFEKMFFADILDIGCMKLSSIIGRGLKRDFIDLYFILKQIDFDFLLEKFYTKYEENGNNIYNLKKSIVNFDDADNEPMPDMIIKTNWNEVKSFFRKYVNRII